MKKIAMFIAAAAMAVSASAEKTTVTGMKATDNIYVGINAGATQLANLKTKDALRAFNPVFGARVGKNFSPVFGLMLNAQAEFNAHKGDCNMYYNKTFVNNVMVDLNGTWNFMNMFAGYKGEPRTFEVIGVTGLGWYHGIPSNLDAVYAKGAIDFAINLGACKQWQVYAEPAIVYGLSSQFPGTSLMVGEGKFNINNANVQLVAGVNYKFGNSNGTRNFAIEQLRDQAEIDALNAQINAAKAEADAAKANAAAKDAEIANLKKALADCQNKPVVKVEKANLQPSVVFKQGSAVVEKSQMPNLEMISKYMNNNKDAKIKISGYASPEGSKEFNQKLSEKRAAACKTVLVNKYKIAADRIETEGLGATDKLFDEVEFNRVSLFNDMAK